MENWDLKHSTIITKKELIDSGIDLNSYDYEAIMVIGKESMEQRFKIIGDFAIAILVKDGNEKCLIVDMTKNPQAKFINVNQIVDFNLN